MILNIVDLRTLESIYIFKLKPVILNSNQISSYNDLSAVISRFDMILVNKHLSNYFAAFMDNIRAAHNRKLTNLGINNDLNPFDHSRVVFNYSSIELSPRLGTILDFSLDFFLPVYKINFCNYFLKYESLIARISKLQGYSENSTKILHKLQVIAFKFYYNFKTYKVFSCIFKRSDVSVVIKL